MRPASFPYLFFILWGGESERDKRIWKKNWSWTKNYAYSSDGEKVYIYLWPESFAKKDKRLQNLMD